MLVEALVATLILTTGLLTMAELVRVAAATNVVARNRTLAGILAEQKIEQLRALAWEFDAGGIPVSYMSTDTTVLPESPSGGTGLQSSPGSLRQNSVGFVDHLDGGGRLLVAACSRRRPPSTRADGRLNRTRRVAALLARFQVLVTSIRNPGCADQGAVTRLPGEARLVTLKVRKPR